MKAYKVTLIGTYVVYVEAKTAMEAYHAVDDYAAKGDFDVENVSIYLIPGIPANKQQEEIIPVIPQKNESPQRTP